MSRPTASWRLRPNHIAEGCGLVWRFSWTYRPDLERLLAKVGQAVASDVLLYVLVSVSVSSRVLLCMLA